MGDLIKNLVALLISVFTGFFGLFPSGLDRLDFDKGEQVQRIQMLQQAYENGKIAPVDETEFFDGDLKKELENGIKFNELRFIATHNSYQTVKTDEYKELYGSLSDLTVGIVDKEKAEFYSETLTEQLNVGVRSFEMDLEVFDRNGDISFTCMHAPYTDMTTSCYDFALALKEIEMWSDNNPGHLPITVIIEPKSGFLPLDNMKELSLEYAKALDAELENELGDKLFTPADMLREYGSFGEMRAADDWCSVKDMTGKVLFLLHEGKITEDYINIDKSVKTQAMFPMLREKDIDRDCTSFVLANEPDEFLKISEEAIFQKRIIARTRADSYTNNPSERREAALSCKAQIVSTDYPPKTENKDGDYILTFENGKTVSSIY